MSDSNIVWNAMKPEYFTSLLNNRRLTLKRLEEYKDDDELQPSKFEDLIKKWVMSCQLATGVVVSAVIDELFRIFSEQRQCTYIQCFYDGETVPETHIKLFGGLAVGFDKEKLIQRCNDVKIQEYERCPLVITDSVRYTFYREIYSAVPGPEELSRFMLFDLGCLFLKSKEDNESEREFRIAKNYRAFCDGEDGKFKPSKLVELGNIQKEIYYANADTDDCFNNGVCKFEYIAIDPCDIVGISMIGDTVGTYKKSDLSCLLQSNGLRMDGNAKPLGVVRRYNVSSIVAN